MKENPRFAAAIIRSPANTFRLLVEQGGKSRTAGQYGLPGGEVENGETFEEAVVREIKEETGLDIVLTELFRQGTLVTQSGEAWQYRIFRCWVRGGNASFSSDVSCAAWFSEADVRANKVSLRHADLRGVLLQDFEERGKEEFLQRTTSFIEELLEGES